MNKIKQLFWDGRDSVEVFGAVVLFAVFGSLIYITIVELLRKVICSC